MAFLEYPFRVGFRDTGNSNKLTNKSFLSFLEDSGGLHSEKAGFGINEIRKTNLSWILIGWKLKVISRPTFGTNITVRTWGRDFSKIHTFRDFEVYDDNNNLVAIATSKWILFDIEKNKITRITPELIEKYTPEQKSVFDENEIDFSIENEPEQVFNTFNYTVSRSDIDINNHMHNLNYLDLAYDSLPEDVYQNIDLKNIEIVYKKECYLNDNLKCNYYFKDNVHYVYIKSLDNSILHAIVKLY